MLLALVDVRPETIAADYTTSTEALASLFAATDIEDQGPIIEGILANRGTTTGEAVLATLDGFDAEQYPLAAGVGSDELDSIRSRLLG